MVEALFLFLPQRPRRDTLRSSRLGGVPDRRRDTAETGQAQRDLPGRKSDWLNTVKLCILAVPFRWITCLPLCPSVTSVVRRIDRMKAVRRGGTAAGRNPRHSVVPLRGSSKFKSGQDLTADGRR
jgi:hypothetical protein